MNKSSVLMWLRGLAETSPHTDVTLEPEELQQLLREIDLLIAAIDLPH
jgi:hypothetical protein